MIKDEIVDGEEGEKIEPGVDDPRFEIHVGEQGAAIGQGPEDAELPVIDPGTAKKNDDQGDDPAESIGQPGGKFRYPEYFERSALHPEEHGRFFPEWLKVDVYPCIIVHFDHFPGTFGEVDLVPVEEVDAPEKGNKKKGSGKDDQQDSGRLI